MFPPNQEKSGNFVLDELMEKYVKLSAKCYEIKPKTDIDNTKTIYTKRYYLPAIFKRFYTVQIEKFTKSIQKEFDEMVRQNNYFNCKLNELFEDAQNKVHTYDHDEKYAA